MYLNQEQTLLLLFVEIWVEHLTEPSGICPVDSPLEYRPVAWTKRTSVPHRTTKTLRNIEKGVGEGVACVDLEGSIWICVPASLPIEIPSAI